jgi:CRISPR-associated protein Csm5
MKVYLLRTATLERKANGQVELRWKQSPRGSVEGHRPETSTPQFAEMASPGTVFEGGWVEKAYYRDPEVLRSLRWRESVTTAAVLRDANDFAARVLEAHRHYAQQAGLRLVAANLAALEERLSQLRGRAQACLLALGWGGGFLTKTAGPNPDDESYRQVLRDIGPFGRSMRPGLPFPKTRRIVFLDNQPATLAGWAQLEIE